MNLVHKRDSLFPAETVAAKPARRWVFRPRLGVFLLLTVLGYFLFSTVRLTLSTVQVSQELKAYEAEKQANLARYRELEAQVQALNDLGTIERIAREDLGLIYPGEKLLVKAQAGSPRPLKPQDPLEGYVD